ncbi:calcium-binding protein [Egbenema bharatensis]|uniref:calcium-binding protein n=1 Tax=Egbenema bharatensis TaxID=3463334 RepID=UPI003A838DF7
MARDNNNDFLTATNLTPTQALNDVPRQFVRFNDSVSSVDDRNDFLTFDLSETSTVELRLTGNATTLELIRNSNNSRFGDPGEIIDFKEISGAAVPGTTSIEIPGLQAGKYGIRVARTNQIAGNPASPQVDYALEARVTAVGPATEGPGGDFGGTNNPTIVPGKMTNNGRNYAGTLSSNDVDAFKFEVDRFTLVSANATSGTKVSLLNAAGDELNSNGNQARLERLRPGSYIAKVESSDGLPKNYELGLLGTPLKGAELAVNFHEIRAIDNFETDFLESGQADFYTKVTIDGQTQQSQVFRDRNVVEPNLTIKRSVDLNKDNIPITIQLFDKGDLFNRDDHADINELRGQRDIVLNYNVLTGRFGGAGVNVTQDGNQVTVRGQDTSDGKRAEVTFSVDYIPILDLPSASLSQNTPVIQGNNRNQTLRGQSADGILNGKGGNDKLYGMGGDDILLGGNGQDTLYGGTGDDILFGGKASDTLVGGAGRDTFVLAAGTGTDLIKDFVSGTDSIGLLGRLTFDDLTIEQGRQGAVIRTGREQLAVLQGVQADTLSAQDFTGIDTTRFRGMSVPTFAV